MEKYEIGKFMIILQENGNLKIISLENKEKLSIYPIANNTVIIISD
jgi:hypothetical protein